MRKMLMVAVLAGVLGLLGLVEPVRAEIEQATLRVDGLACPFCAYGLEKKINRIKGVSSYDVDMKEGKVFVGFEAGAQIEPKSLYKAVKEAGFTLRSISLRAKGRISRSKEGLVLLAGETNNKFFLFESEALSRKYHQGKAPDALGGELKRKLIKLMESGKEVLIEGVVHEHEGLPAGLSIGRLEIME